MLNPKFSDKNDKEKHKYCKSLMMDLEMDEMAKAGMFKTVIKKKEMYVKPALAYAKVVVKKLLEKASTYTILKTVFPLKNLSEVDSV